MFRKLRRETPVGVSPGPLLFDVCVLDAFIKPSEEVAILQLRGSGFPAAMIEAESLSHTWLPMGWRSAP
jgi:hypothetical protein